jgi:glycine/D-amino acid oxidase-like deaminating enzyme/nitrite reductase/ring-hydroxylating ferredoxin subunit
MNAVPCWFDELKVTAYSPLIVDLTVDALVIGGGISGVTTAYLLAIEGLSVALAEKEKIGGRDTGHTTAHLTYMTDTRLSELVATHSKREARIAWQAGKAAMDFIRSTVEGLGLDCGLIRVPGYLAAAVESEEEKGLLKREAALAGNLGFDSTFIDSDPVSGRSGIRFEDQMKFHPLRYLAGLVEQAWESGVLVFEDTEVTDFRDGRVTANGRTIYFKDVFLTTHVPLQGNSATTGAAFFQTKLAPYSRYAIGARIPAAAMEELIWSDTADPFHFLRIDRHGDSGFAILGGEDHKTGQEAHTEEPYRRLEQHLARLLPEAVVTHHWSGQVVETADGLPFIGQTGEHQFIATGFSGNGMTFGTVAGLMARDAITGKDTPWARTFDPGRKVLAALGEYLKENRDYPVRMISDRMHVPEEDPAELPKGCGKVLEHDGERLAAYRDYRGELHLLSAVCPHLGCIVAWNKAEKTWDCPFHGSRFKATDEVIAGPAETDLSTSEQPEPHQLR